jgi:hypothetical protein
LYVPAAQGCAAGVPATQKLPRGHTPPVASPGGVDERALPRQTNPCEQGPDGAVSPAVAQKEPAGHAEQLAAAALPELGEKVPGGHCTADAERATQ